MPSRGLEEATPESSLVKEIGLKVAGMEEVEAEAMAKKRQKQPKVWDEVLRS